MNHCEATIVQQSLLSFPRFRALCINIFRVIRDIYRYIYIYITAIKQLTKTCRIQLSLALPDCLVHMRSPKQLRHRFDPQTTKTQLCEAPGLGDPSTTKIPAGGCAL